MHNLKYPDGIIPIQEVMMLFTFPSAFFSVIKQNCI